MTFLEAPFAYLGVPVARADKHPREDSPLAQLENVLKTLYTFGSPFRGTPDYRDLFHIGTEYNPSLWTLPVEFYGSMVVFMLLLALGRVRSWIRLLVMLFAVHYTLFLMTYWDLALFMAGAVLAEIHLIQVEGERDSDTYLPLPATGQDDSYTLDGSLMADVESTSSSSRAPVKAHSPVCHSPGRKTLEIIAFLASLFILSIPSYEDATSARFPYQTIWSLTPANYCWREHYIRFWPCIGGIWLICVVDMSRIVQSIFTNSVSQYLGRISYSLYLVHATVPEVVGERLCGAMRTQGYSDQSAALITTVLVMPLVLIVADAFTRGVDESMVVFARWSYAKICVRA